MRIVFMGTPPFAADILRPLASHYDVIAAYTRPDAVRGRGKTLVASAVKEEAQRLGIEVFTPRSLRNEEVQAQLAALEPDVIVVAAYGAILPKAVLDIPRRGCLNVHGSLLPKWRGAAPIERAVLAGDAQVGVCIMEMEEGLDTGAYCVCRSVEAAGKSVGTLTRELAELGSEALLVALDQLKTDSLEWVVQDESQVTYAEKIAKGELNLSPDDAAQTALRKVLASSAAHPSRVDLAGRRITLLEALPLENGTQALAEGIAPGEVRSVAKRLFMGFSDGAIELQRLQPDGKRPMDAKAFSAGIQGIKQGNVKWEALHD